MSLRRAAAAVVLFAAATAAHAQFVINEGFNNVATLAGSGWILANASAPLGTTPGWYQGDQTIFTSQAGAPQAYLAANYNNAAAGGTLANWLISPTFSTQDAGAVSFYVRADVVPGLQRHARLGLQQGRLELRRLRPRADHVIGADWTQVHVSFAAKAPARPAGSRSSTPARPTSPTTSAWTPSPWRFRSPRPGRSCSPVSPVWAC